jgi:hypothetical protein
MTGKAMTGKQLVRAVLEPLARPVLRRIDARLDDRFRAQTERIDALNGRLEFVRKEILFELRYKPHERTSEAGVEPSILNREKLDRMDDAVRLNLGAGHLSKSEYLNVDTRALDGIDVIADVRSLPFDPDSLAEIYSAHVLEHFPVEELTRVLLPYWVSLLRPGGEFVAVVPDMETMIAEYSAGRLEFEELRDVMYGSQEYDGNFHFNGFSQASIRALFEAAGLTEVNLRVSGRRNGLCYEMEIAGVRPTGEPAR